MSEIIEGKLFLGSIEDALNEKWLQQNSIKLIVTVMNEPIEYIDKVKKIAICHSIEHHIISISDMSFENILENIYDICDIINRYDKVFIHCMYGISRSATISIAYIMLTYHLYLNDATKLVLKNRNFIFPNDGFIKQLINLEKNTYGLMTYLPDKNGICKYKKLLHGYE